VPIGLVALPLAGLVLLVVGVQQRRAAAAVLRASAQTPGVVVDHVHAAGMAGGSGILCPVVRYRLADGTERVFTSPDGQMPPRHRVGESVVVYYDPARPDAARLATSTALPSLLIVVGVALLGVSGLVGAISWWVMTAVRGS
jgi:hypothetical protein